MNRQEGQRGTISGRAWISSAKPYLRRGITPTILAIEGRGRDLTRMGTRAWCEPVAETVARARGTRGRDAAAPPEERTALDAGTIPT